MAALSNGILGLVLWAAIQVWAAEFADPSLAAAVEEAAGVSAESATAAELLEVKDLNASGLGITSLAGIESLGSLAVLGANGVHIVNLFTMLTFLGC